jgi:hypothetical protein
MRLATCAALALLCGSEALALPPGFVTDAPEAMDRARAEDKLILVFFNQYG